MSNQKLLYFVLIPLVFLVDLSGCDKNKNGDKSPYENSTAIISALPANLRSTIGDRSYASLVFFYQNWCAECINQIELNLELEKEFVHWQTVMKFVVVNYDSQIARDYNITGSFQYKLMRPNSRPSQIIGLELNGMNTKDNIVKETVVALSKVNKTSRLFKEPGWTKLDPLNNSNQTNNFTNNTLLFVHNDNSIEKSLVSLETILDFSNYQQQINILHCNISFFLVSLNQKKEHIDNSTALYQFVEKGQQFKLIGQGSNRTEFRNLIINKFLTSNWRPIRVNTTCKLKNITTDYTANKTDSYLIHYRDLNNALRKVIYSDFCRFKLIDADKLSNMTNLTIAFRDYFTYDNENTRRFLRRISQWLKEHNTNETMKVDKFKAIIKAGAEGFLPVEQPYISCNGSESHLRGYPCSIWLLFHSLTVQEYIRFNSTNQTWIKKSNFTLEPHSVLPLMRGYIRHFFPCTSCVQNMERDMMNLESELVNPNSSILWLWREHNKLNLMLKNKSNDDPAWPKNIYPSYESCKTCYLRKPIKVEKLDDLNTVQWNETAVVDYLVSRYRKESLVKSAALMGELTSYLLLLIIYPLISGLFNRII